MILFRTREWGSAEWLHLAVGGVEDDGDEFANRIASVVGTALDHCNLHVQVLNDQGEWEEIE